MKTWTWMTGVLMLAALPWGAWASEGTISGPVVFRNLQVFLVHGEAQLDHRAYVTLDEAIRQEIVVVKETGQVAELTIENVSKDRTVFVHAGDIVKGGRQDRTIRHDVILPPLSGPVPLAALCVESGRWSGRGGEDVAKFSAGEQMLSSRSMRVASRSEGSQQDVWGGIAQQQEMLSENISALAGREADVRDARSPSSLQLSLESDELKKVVQEYETALKAMIEGKADVIGLVYAINGEINTAEVYNSGALFRTLWPKLLHAAIVEAVAEYREGKTFEPVAAEALPAFFATALAGTTQEEELWKSTVLKTYTTATTLLFETLDVEASRAWIHKTFIYKGEQRVVVPLDPVRPMPRR